MPTQRDEWAEEQGIVGLLGQAPEPPRPTRRRRRMIDDLTAPVAGQLEIS